MGSVDGIVVLPRSPSHHAGDARLWTRTIGGLPLLLRQARLLKISGCQYVYVLGDAEDEPLIAAVRSGRSGLPGAQYLIRRKISPPGRKEGREQHDPAGPFVIMSVNWAFGKSAIMRAVAEARHAEKLHNFADQGGAVGLTAAPAGYLQEALAVLDRPPPLPDTGVDWAQAEVLTDDECPAVIHNETELSDAERQLWEGCRKEEDGIVSTHFNRYLSLAISRRLANYPISPNYITIGNLILGLTAAFLVSLGEYWFVLFGALLLQANSILDGVDGELARMRLQSSVMGEWLDTLGDDIANVLFFAALGYGAWQRTGSKLWLWVAILSATAMLAIALIYYAQLIAMGRGDVLAIGWFKNRKSRIVTGNSISKILIDFGTTVFRKDLLVASILVAAIFDMARFGLLVAMISAWLVLGAQLVALSFKIIRK